MSHAFCWKNHRPPDTLRKCLTKISSLTKLIQHDACYHVGMIEEGCLNRYQIKVGVRKHKRLVTELRNVMSAASELAPAEPLRKTVTAIVAATEGVLAACDHFPSDAEWPGLAPWVEQERLIAVAKSQGA